MKKLLIPIVLALVIGTTFGFIFFKNTQKDIATVFSEKKEVSIFQIGVFANEENALNYKNKYSGSIIVKDDYYRVYYGVFFNNSCILKMEEYLNDNGIAYYIRKLNIDNQNLIKELEKFESILISTTDVEVFLKTNEQMLQLFLEGRGD